MLCLAFSYVKAQTILVNSNVISVQEDVTFPLWLDSMSTIEIGTQVVSISALEFNIVPANNGNSLVFSQTKTITSQETVPNGMTWKITAVLLDSTAINNSSSSGGGQVIVSGSGGNNFPVAVSEESPSSMNFGNAMIYCDSLQENGFDDWVIPTFEELVFVSSGGVDLPGNRSSNYLWTAHSPGTGNDIKSLQLSLGNVSAQTGDFQYFFVRCVRHATATTTGTSGGSGTNSASNDNGGILNIGTAINLEFDSIIYDNTGSINFTAEILPSGGGSITNRGFCWSATDSTPTVNDNYIGVGNGSGTFSKTFYPRQDSTTYYIRAYAANPGGMIYSSVQSFTTEFVYGMLYAGGYIYELDGNGGGKVFAPSTYASNCGDLSTTAASLTINGFSDWYFNLSAYYTINTNIANQGISVSTNLAQNFFTGICCSSQCNSCLYRISNAYIMANCSYWNVGVVLPIRNF